ERQLLTTGFNPVKRVNKNIISPSFRKSSVGTTGINDGFQPGGKSRQKQHISLYQKEFRRNDR
ncbi:MAG TPA: hypothetical protein PLY48_05885, partial [Candidatus Cloacimonas acidaminovorans]|nr:hypothetical protein [Candidatus Cloacimonas acidaminovorans]